MKKKCKFETKPDLAKGYRSIAASFPAYIKGVQ
jgi:hypothetical protein